MSISRIDGRAPHQLRPLTLTPGWAKNADGSCLIEFGDTKVLCTATIDNGVPAWKRGQGSGWLTAEYGMLPRSTGKRTPRPESRPRPDGRSIEISRLIGRSLRAACNLDALGERTITLDCDVLQADGGTRCAAITGAWVALAQALEPLQAKGQFSRAPLPNHVAAVSVGIFEGQCVLDLNYHEDARAEVDMNVVMTGEGRLVEVQASGEGATFARGELDVMLALAEQGIAELVTLQRAAVANFHVGS